MENRHVFCYNIRFRNTTPDKCFRLLGRSFLVEDLEFLSATNSKSNSDGKGSRANAREIDSLKKEIESADEQELEFFAMRDELDRLIIKN